MSDPDEAAPPPIARVLETALYVDDLSVAARFYDDLFGFRHLFENETLVALDVGGSSALLLFRRGGSDKDQTLPGGVIPAHDGAGRLHIAFPVLAEDLRRWEQRLLGRGIEIEGRVDWPKGGHSVYFRDPDGNLLELATPGLWEIY